MSEATKLSVNAVTHTVDTPLNRPLLDVLREDLDLTGSKVSCGEGACGACTVLIDGRPVRSCVTPISAALGRPVLTVEGLAVHGQLHPLQQAFLDADAMQCGYCTPGMIMASISLLKEKPDATEEEIREGLEGNLCRCTGYENIIKAVQMAQSHLSRQPAPTS